MLHRTSSRVVLANRIVADLPRRERQRIARVLRQVTLAEKAALLVPGRRVRTVYFLSRGLCTVSVRTGNGATFEVATVGDEGFIGIEALFGGGVAVCAARMTVRDDAALTMSVRAFQDEMRAGGMFATLVNRYASTFVESLMRSVACNALHGVQARCARWLLTMGERLGRRELPVTHASMAAALGVRRPTITLAVGALQRRGIVAYSRRRLVILDPRGLRSAACECSAVSTH
jgi:CRP-like cAMP-binding protein